MRTHTIIQLSLLLAWAATSGCGDKVANQLAKVDDAIAQLDRGLDSFDQAKDILGRLEQGLTSEAYKRQVSELIATAGMVGENFGKAYLDFVVDRLKDGLRNISYDLRGQTAPPSKPVLSNTESPIVDYSSANRTKVTIVGWNLDVAEKDPERFPLIVEGARGVERVVSKTFYDFQGQYSVTINTSNNGGVPLLPGDAKFVFKGYDKPFALLIINSTPTSPPLKSIVFTLTSIVVDGDGDSGTDGGDFEGKVVLVRPDGSESTVVNLDAIDGVGHDTNKGIQEGQSASVKKSATIRLLPGQGFAIHGRGIREKTGNDHDFMDNHVKLAESFTYENVNDKLGNAFKTLDDGDQCKLTFHWNVRLE